MVTSGRFWVSEVLPTLEAGDNHISADVLLPLGGVLRWGKVISCKHNADSNTVGQANEWPILNTRTYDIEFNDGTITELMANKIAKCIYAQCDPGVFSTYCLIVLLILTNC
jgi:hypothetical protein